MAEGINRIIHKADHWPLEKRREYLIAAFRCEKTRHRRGKISKALRDITTKTLQQEIRHERS